MNSYLSPCEDNVREFIKSLQRRDTERDQAQYADKGANTLLDGYLEAQFEQICRELWTRNAGTSTSTESHLRTLADMQLGHYMLGRGDNRRSIEISDMHTFEFSDEGHRCFPIIMITRKSKKN